MGQRARHSTKRSGCDCLNPTPLFSDNPQGGRCEYCSEIVEPTGTGTITYNRQAPCYFIAMFGCDHYTNDAEREHVAVPCLVLRKRCNNQSCIWDSRWQCDGTSNPNQDQPWLKTQQCYFGQDGLAGLSNFVPCRDVVRCGGVLTAVPGSTFTDGAFNISCAHFNWEFGAVDTETCPEFAAIAGQSGGPVICCACEDADTLECPTGRVGYLDISCCDDRMLWNQGNLDCIIAPTEPTDEDYAAYEADPTQFCNFIITHNDIPVTECTWADDPCTGVDGCASPGTEFGEGTGIGGDEVDALSCFTKWELVPTSATTATFRGRSRRGYYANYVCNDWNCYRRCTFTMAPGAGGDYSHEMIGLPLCLCIVPHNFPSSPCVNSGQDACCDTGGPTINVKISAINCAGNEVISEQYWPFTRGIALPCGVNNPVAPGDECLYFGAYIPVEEDCPDWGGELFVVMTCGLYPPVNGPIPCPGDTPDGSTGLYSYGFTYYCLNQDTGCWEVQGTLCQRYDCTCLGPNPPAATFVKTCCCECQTCFPGTATPPNLTVEFSSDCAALNGMSFTVIPDPLNPGTWITDDGFGNSSVPFPGGGSVEIIVQECAIEVRFTGTCLPDTNVSGPFTSFACAPFDKSATFELAVSGSGCGCSDPVSVTFNVTE